jgi:hypothetical protein
VHQFPCTVKIVATGYPCPDELEEVHKVLEQVDREVVLRFQNKTATNAIMWDNVEALKNHGLVTKVPSSIYWQYALVPRLARTFLTGLSGRRQPVATSHAKASSNFRFPKQSADVINTDSKAVHGLTAANLRDMATKYPGDTERNKKVVEAFLKVVGRNISL